MLKLAHLNWRLFRGAVSTTLAVTAFVAMGEIDRIIAGVTIGGNSYSAGSAFGPFAVIGAKAPFDAWSLALVEVPDLQRWVLSYAGAALVFVTGLIGCVHTVWPEKNRNWRWLSDAFGGIVVAQLVLGLWLTQLAVHHAHAVARTAGSVEVHAIAPKSLHQTGSGFLIGLLNMLSCAKLIALALAVIALGVAIWDDVAVRAQLGSVGRALKAQRFSLLVVGLLAALLIQPGKDIADQLPDVERSWLGVGWHVDWWHVVVALLAQVALTVLLIVLARLRDLHAADKLAAGQRSVGRDQPTPHAMRAWAGDEDERDQASWKFWVAFAGSVAALAVLLRLTRLAHLEWWHTGALIVVPLTVAASSWFVERHATPHRPRLALTTDQPERESPTLVLERDMRFTSSVGNLIAIAAFVLLGVSLVRAFIGLAVLNRQQTGPAWTLAGVGAATALATWFLLAVDWGPRQDVGTIRDTTGSRLRRAVPSWLLVTGVAVGFVVVLAAVALLVYPASTSKAFGVLGTTVVALGALTIVLGILASRVQSIRPLAIFPYFGLRTTPVILLVLLVGLVPGLFSSFGVTTPLHEIRQPADHGRADRPELTSVVSRWLEDEQTASCAKPVGSTADGREVRMAPLVLVAAAGGGIRAAWWTVQSMAVLDGSPCGKRAVVVASGVSGGSVGLAVTASSDDPLAAVRRLADPPALSAAAGGLLERDLVSGFTGMDTAAFGAPDGARYPDRAALMEQAWEKAAPGLRQPFPLADSARHVPWRLILNSTSVRTGCRVLITDVRTQLDDVRAANPQDCFLGSPQAAAGSYDLFDALPCLHGVRLSTAAMLSARFAYITPSGVLPGCTGDAVNHKQQTDQLIDGGYDEASGIGSLVDLAPLIMPLVRAYNDAALRSTTGPITVVVPTLVYLDNHIRADPPLGPPPYVQHSEVLVPSYLLTRNGGVLNGSETLLQRASAVTASWLDCSNSDAACGAVVDAVSAKMPNQVILVAPRKDPQVVAPLGWVLSQASRDSMGLVRPDGSATGQIARQATLVCGPHTTNAKDCPADIGGLGDLLPWLR